jgi:hypothetical protein
MNIENNSELCHTCRGLTFVMLRDGFKHPLPYSKIISSGKRCQLCRLIVCSMSKLQTKFGSYELENHYNALSESLPFRPAIFRQCGLDTVPWHLTEQLNLLQDIT